MHEGTEDAERLAVAPRERVELVAAAPRKLAHLDLRPRQQHIALAQLIRKVRAQRTQLV